MSDSGWYYAENGKTIGPMTRDQLVTALPKLQGGATLVFGPNMSQWTVARHVAGLWADRDDFFQNRPATPPAAAASRRAHEIDYKIYGDDMQFVEIELDPGETIVAEAGAMMYMTSGIRMDTHFGDPSADNQGLLGKVFSAGKRILTGESLFMTTFSNSATGKERVAFAAPYPGKIIPVDLAQHRGELLCEKNSFLCAARGVTVGIAFTKRIGAGLFGGEGFILQRLKGDGFAFVHAGGTICRRELQPGEQLKVDTGCIVALEASIDYDIHWVGGIKNTLFGGEGLFLARLTGPGNIWIQSLPFVRLADRIHATGQTRARKTGEGSILGPIGGILDGDNR